MCASAAFKCTPKTVTKDLSVMACQPVACTAICYIYILAMQQFTEAVRSGCWYGRLGGRWNYYAASVDVHTHVVCIPHITILRRRRVDGVQLKEYRNYCLCFIEVTGHLGWFIHIQTKFVINVVVLRSWELENRNEVLVLHLEGKHNRSKYMINFLLL